jgi:hypothetical protein
VFAEGLALLFLIWLVWALGRLIPGIGIFIRAVPGVYYDRLRLLIAPARDTL